MKNLVWPFILLLISCGGQPSNQTTKSNQDLAQIWSLEQRYMATTPLRVNPFQPVAKFPPLYACPVGYEPTVFSFGGYCYSWYQASTVLQLPFENITVQEVNADSVPCPGSANPGTSTACTSFHSDGSVTIAITSALLSQPPEPEQGLAYEFGNVLLQRAGDYSQGR